MMINIYAALAGFLAGAIAGAVSGMFFHDENFLGGYPSWKRRLVRLGHISFFGLGLINLSLALAARSLGIESELTAASVLLLVAIITMPTACYLAAFRKSLRQLFAVPVLSAIVGISLFLWKVASR